MKKTIFYGTVVLGLFFSLTIGVAIAAPDKHTPNPHSINGRENAQTKLDEVKLKVCQNKQNAIKQRSDQLTKMAENMIETFDQIADRVEQYYTSKVVPSGKTVSNYNDLVTDIAAKKEIVKTDLKKANADAAAFSCKSDDPKGQLVQFRTDMQQVKQSLKDYRTSIRNLIVAVRSLNSTPSSSPTPTLSPTPTSSSSKEAE